MPAFQFSQVSQSADGNTLTGNWRPDADLPMFAGHFPGLPIMPAVAQIAMLQALIRQHSPWSTTTIIGGTKLKFSARIQPGDTLTLRLQRSGASFDTSSGTGSDIGSDTDTVRFSITNQAGPASQGLLTLSGAPGSGREDG